VSGDNGWLKKLFGFLPDQLLNFTDDLGKLLIAGELQQPPLDSLHFL
jgi:hypothetical protein